MGHVAYRIQVCTGEGEGGLTTYADFLDRKRIVDLPTGLMLIPSLPSALFQFQHDITAWALRRGRAALFAGTGLGKGLMELSWAQAV